MVSCALLASLVLAAHVQAGAAPGGDGSADRPFATIASAMTAGARELDLEPGLYPEALTLDRPLVLRGHGKVVIAAPPGAPVAIASSAEVQLQDLTIQGGRVGLQVQRSTATLDRVRLVGQPEVALACTGRCVVREVQLESSFASAIGARGPGELEVHGLSIHGPFRRAVELEPGTLTGERLAIDGPVTGIHAVGASVRLREAELHGLRGSCLFASGGEVSLIEPVFSGCEVALESREGASLRVRGGLIARCARAAIALTESHLEARDLVIEGPSRDGALVLVGGDASLSDVLVHQPGPTGVLARLARIRFDEVSVLGARTDAAGDFGNALFAFDAQLSGRGLFARGCNGPAIEVQLGRGRLADVEVEQNPVASLALEHSAQLDLDGLIASDRDGAGVACIERGSSTLRAPWLRGFPAGPWLVDCSCDVRALPPDPRLVKCGTAVQAPDAGAPR